MRPRAALAGAGRALAAAGAWLWRRRPAPGWAAAAAFLAAVALLGLADLAFQATLADRLPRAVDWAAAAALLEESARPGDAVAVAPAWAERARAVLPPTLPVLALPGVDREPLPAVRRLWLVSLPGAPGFPGAVEAGLAARAAAVEAPVALGRLALARYDLARPELPLAFLPDRLSDATVDAGGAACTRTADGFACADGARVSRALREVGGGPRPCLVVTVGRAPVTVTFPGVRVGAALAGSAGALGPAAPVPVAVRVDGVAAGAAEVGGWAPLRFETAARAGPARTVALAIGPASGGTPASLCLEAWTVP